MACFCCKVGSRVETLLINEFPGKKKVVGELTEEGKDAFWSDTVPCGCRLASELTDSEAGAAIVAFQTLKSQRERMAAQSTGMKF